MEFSQIAILLTVAGIFGIIAKTFKQPLIIGYLLAGLLLGALGVVYDSSSLANFGQIGVALLLFLLGLEMNLSELPSIGKVAILTGLGQIIFTWTIGFLISTALGFDLLPSIYIAVALTFSSTIIMVKLLSQKKDLSSLYGKIAVGFLLVQDFVAVAILMFLSGIGKGSLTSTQYLIIGLKAVILFVLVWALSKKIIPYVFEKFAATPPELLFIVSIAWALGVSSLVAGPFGFTLEIGGFLAGLALSNMPENLQIASRARPLRDFFLTIFFLYLGTQLVIGQSIVSLIPAAVLLSTFVLVGNPTIVLSILGFLGYKKRTAFLAGLTVAQISEFSLIIMAVGASLGHVKDSHVALVVMIGVITMTSSTYMILGADKIYKRIHKYLNIFERGGKREKALVEEHELEDHVVLIGCHRTGKALSAFFQRNNIPFVVIDFNPEVYNRLNAENIHAVFGDISDPEIIEASGIEKAKMVLSTISNLEDNLTLIKHIRGLKKKPLTVFTASSRYDALLLYEHKADYVVVPDIAAGDYIKHLLATYGVGSNRLSKMGKNHFNRLLFK
jgi:Kef-type K+ transport system membrane component KefB